MSRPSKPDSEKRISINTTIDPKTKEKVDRFGPGNMGRAFDWAFENLSEDAKKQLEVKGLEFLLS
jgi:hypothetical protein